MERVKQPKPVPDLVDRNVPLVRDHRLVPGAAAGDHARHAVAVDPAPVQIELLAAVLHDAREVAVPADALVQVAEEVDVEGVVGAAAGGGAPGDVGVVVGDADALVVVEALAGDVVDDAGYVDEVKGEAVAEVG